MNIDALVNEARSPELDFTYPIKPQFVFPPANLRTIIPRFTTLPHKSVFLPPGTTLEMHTLARFKAASFKAYELLKSLGVPHSDAVKSVFKTLAPGCREFDSRFSNAMEPENEENTYAAVMKEEIDKLCVQGCGETEIMGVFIGRLESAVKIKAAAGDTENWKSKKRKIGDLPDQSREERNMTGKRYKKENE